MKYRGETLLDLIITWVPLLFLAAFLYPVFQRARSNAQRATCQANLKQIGLALLQYTQDSEGTLPDVNGTGSAYGWADTILPYTKSTALYHCPVSTSNSAQTNPKQRNYTDYWMNDFQATPDSTATIGLPMHTIVVGDGNTGRDATTARYALKQLPPAWLKEENSPAYRHLDGMNLLFADGHVKFYKPNRITQSPHNGPSFALR